MKYLRLFALLLLMPTTGLFAQIEEPNFIDPDDELYLDTDSLPLTDSTTTVFNDKIDIDNSTVLQMLDMVVGICYFQDSFLDIDTTHLNI